MTSKSRIIQDILDSAVERQDLGILNILKIFPILIFQQGVYSLYLYGVVTFVATLVFASALLKTTFLTSKMQFSFYYAKACMKLVSKKEDEDEKMRYLIKGIRSYNTYLSKEFRCQIDYFRIYTKIINSPTRKERNQ